jgi:mono/diheme cytochrome c family protein
VNLLHQWRRHWFAGLLGLGVAALTVAAHAQNLDQGKSAPKLFADGCATCHRSPRGLAKGRFSFTLSMFLKDHYTSGSDQASALASYLTSVDSGPPSHAPKRPHSASGSRSSPRRPASVPGQSGQ